MENRGRIRAYSKKLSNQMLDFMDILREGAFKKKLLGTLTQFGNEIFDELREYEEEQSSLISKCESKLFDYYKMGKRMKSKFFFF